MLLYPVLQPAEILASGFRGTRGSDPSGKKVNELSWHVTRCHGVEFYATSQLMKIIVTFQPNDFCVSKLHGYDPKFSEESFKAGLKLVGCTIKEL